MRKKAQTEVRHFCLKHLKNETHAKKRGRKLLAFPQILFPEKPQKRDTRLKNKIGMYIYIYIFFMYIFGNRFTPPLT